MLPPRQLAAVLASLPLVSGNGPWSRAIGYRHLVGPPPGRSGPPQPLWGGAARLFGARFTPQRGFDSIYLADNPITAFIEASALILLPSGPVPRRSAPWTVVTVDGVLNGLLDLTDPAVLAALGTTRHELTGNWVTSPRPPTQVLGQSAFNSGRIVGLKYASAKHPGGTNLVVFPDRIGVTPGDHLEVFDPHGQLAQRIP